MRITEETQMLKLTQMVADRGEIFSSHENEVDTQTAMYQAVMLCKARTCQKGGVVKPLSVTFAAVRNVPSRT